MYLWCGRVGGLYNSLCMAILKVSHMGHPVLRKAAKALVPTEIRTPQFQKLIDEVMAQYGPRIR